MRQLLLGQRIKIVTEVLQGQELDFRFEVKGGLNESDKLIGELVIDCRPLPNMILIHLRETDEKGRDVITIMTAGEKEVITKVIVKGVFIPKIGKQEKVEIDCVHFDLS